MTAPDQPMRERIAEALFLTRFKPDGRERMRRAWREYGPAGRNLWPHIYVEADAVLDLWADLSDAAAEAGAKALCIRGGMPGVDEWVCTRHSRVVASAGGLCEDGANEARAVHVATMAAIKEGL